MSAFGLAIALAAALGLLGLVCNHVYARLALVELMLNEGLPPGHEVIRGGEVTADPVPALGAGVHVFLSRNCHACQRLLEELDQAPLTLDTALVLRYVDRPRPIAFETANKLGAAVHDHQVELSTQLGADPLPYTIAVGAHDLVSRGVTPTVQLMLDAARNAGIVVETTRASS